MEVELHPVDGKTVVTEDVEPVVLIEPAKRSRGRPPGAKNKTKPEAAPEPVEAPVEESSEEPAEPEPIIKRKKKKKVVVESESEEELPKRIRRKKPELPPLSPRAHAVKLRQDYHNQRVQGYTNLLSEMLSY
jgi:hypothetical protein